MSAVADRQGRIAPVVTAEELDRLEGVRHAFFSRRGGLSRGIYSSLNCSFGSGDAAETVAGNRARAMEMVDRPAGSLVTVYQVHSPRAVVVEEPWQRSEAPRADGMATDRPGVTLGILTADCAPVLFADAAAGVIGAAHAGWRGARDGIVEAVVEAMVGLGAKPDRISAAVGPCIAQASYEVGPEFPALFAGVDPDSGSFFRPAERTEHFMFDLEGYVARRLRRAGVGSVACLSRDTCAEEDTFFSYRRSCLRNEPDYGRGLSAIALAG